jgi:hypothetical protein
VQLAAGSQPTSLVLPFGYMNITTSGIGISEVTAAPVSFTSQGTSIPYGTFADNVNTPTSFLVFKTGLGRFVYLALTISSGIGDAPDYSLGAAFYGSYKLF